MMTIRFPISLPIWLVLFPTFTVLIARYIAAKGFTRWALLFMFAALLILGFTIRYYAGTGGCLFL
jgi:hypothetical protein